MVIEGGYKMDEHSWEAFNVMQGKFVEFILERNVVGFFEKAIELRSGRMSNWYVNWRDVSADVFSLENLSEFVLSFTDCLELEPDCFYGVPEGATCFLATAFTERLIGGFYCEV